MAVKLLMNAPAVTCWKKTEKANAPVSPTTADAFEHGRDQCSRQYSRNSKGLSRIDTENPQGIELVADGPGAEVGADRGCAGARDHQHRHEPGTGVVACLVLTRCLR
jgi:hypothetical protein